MTPTAQVRRALSLAVAMLAAAATLFSASTVAPSAAKANPSVLAAFNPDGGNQTLREKLDAAARGYIDAKAKFDASTALAASLNAKMADTKLQLELLTNQVSEVAAVSYRSGRLGPVSALLQSKSPEDFLSRAAGVEALALYSDTQLKQLRTLRRQLTQQQDRLLAELQVQAQQKAAMEKQMKDAQRALAAAGGGQATGGFLPGNSPAAKPAPRNADGSWPKEYCTVDDPTTSSGCLTPRTYHAYQQTKAAGFNHYVSCWRSGGGGEHPMGRACDWAAAQSGFGGVAYGADKAYGDRLAGWYVANANALGVMYVIWYNQVWMPGGGGWRAYTGGNGDPASDHTNHVHLSVY